MESRSVTFECAAVAEFHTSGHSPIERSAVSRGSAAHLPDQGWDCSNPK